MYPNRTFVSFYRLRAGMVTELLIRPEVTVPKTPVFKGSFVATADNGEITALITDAVSVVDGNELSPVTVPNTVALSEEMSDMISLGIAATTGNETKASLKVDVAIANSGPNAGQGVMVFTYRHLNTVTVTEVPLENPEPE